MASQNQLGTSYLPKTAGGAITANSMVKIDTTNNRVVACTAIADGAHGVCVDTATAAGNQVRVQTIAGTEAKARYGATITAGQELMVKAGGTGELDVAAGATAISVAIAVEGGASGDICTVMLLTPTGKAPANT